MYLMQYINFLKGVVIPEFYSTRKPVTKETFLLSSHLTGSEKRPNNFTTTATYVISEIANTDIHSAQKHVTIKKKSHVTEFKKRSNKFTTTARYESSRIANKSRYL